MIHSPYASKIEKGGYSAIVFKDGDSVVAEDNRGTIIKEDSNAVTTIQAAIDSLTTKLGSVLVLEGSYDVATAINIRDGISLFGQGAGTIFFVPDATNPTHLKIINLDTKSNVHLSNFCIDGNLANQTSGLEDGIWLAGGSHIKLTNLTIKNIYGSEGHGLCVYNLPSDVLIQGNSIYNIADDGLDINGMIKSQIAGNNIDNCGDNGIDTEGAEYIAFTGNVITDCDGNGLELEQEGLSPSTTRYCTASGNVIKDSAIDGIHIRSGSYNSVTGNTIVSSGRYGIYLTKTSAGGNADYNVIVGNSIVDSVNYGIYEVNGSADYNFFTGNYLRNNRGGSYQESIGGTHSQSNNNIWIGDYHYPAIEAKKRWYRNSSGGTIAAGSVVILDASSGSVYYFTTTTSGGDDKVLGMVLESSSGNATSALLLEGRTYILKANGTADIAIADFLTTYTVAGIACKATAGDMAFAIALEAYAADDSNGVLTAQIISPRKI